MEQQVNPNYSKAIQLIKGAILKSRYRAAALANRELLSLYYGIGKYISENSRQYFWGTGAIETISKQLQQELPGLRGFSEGNLRKMRIFFEEWEILNSNRSLSTNEIQETNITIPNSIRELSADEIQTDLLFINRSLPANDLQSYNF